MISQNTDSVIKNMLSLGCYSEVKRNDSMIVIAIHGWYQILSKRRLFLCEGKSISVSYNRIEVEKKTEI